MIGEQKITLSIIYCLIFVNKFYIPYQSFGMDGKGRAGPGFSRAGPGPGVDFVKQNFRKISTVYVHYINTVLWMQCAFILVNPRTCKERARFALQ